MKILFDHNLDRRLRLCFTEHETATAQEQGWADVVNGKLIALAESHDFQVLLTADANIKNQQNLSSRSISILIMRAYDNRLATHVQMVEIAKLALRKIETGEIVEVFHPLMKRYQ